VLSGICELYVMVDEYVVVGPCMNESMGTVVEQEEEQRMRRVASNIAKDVKKFWLKVDKLVRMPSLQAGC
jgi:hypothetical protein